MMKVRFPGTVLLVALLTFFSCDDNTGTIGIEMLPDSDGLSAHTATFDVKTESYLTDAVYAKTSTGYVGKFTDPQFGFYESSFLTELNCVQDFSLPEVYKYNEATGTGSGSMAGDSVAAARLVVYYSSWFGDSLNACRMSVYELDKKLDKNRYTDIDPQEYIQDNLLLGRSAYSAYDTTIPDSVRSATDDYGTSTYYPYVSFPLDKNTFGEDRILKPYREHPEYFKDAEAFIDNIFKGVYVKCDYGDGTILYVDRVDLQMQFRFHYVNDSTGVALTKTDGTDSLYYSYQTVFASTKEVIQANRFSNSAKIKELVESESEQGHTYLKTPAGIYTQATLPYDEIYTQLEGDTLNAVKLSFECYRQEDYGYKFSMSAPSTVLLIRKTDLKSFFEDNCVADYSTSFIATHSEIVSYQYVFSNIARLVTTCINEKQDAKKEAGSSWDEATWEAENPDWNKVLIIPVSVTYDSSSTGTMTAVENDLTPTYAKLKGGPEGDALKLEVTYTRFNQ